MTFQELNLIAPILKAVAEEGYETPTPIQAQAIPLLLEGRDLVGCAQTGTGKTAAFSIPILQILSAKPHHSTHRKSIRCLILTPTRELALQIGESLAAYGRHLPLKTAVIFGGVSQGAQTETLRKGVDILVATPGRLLDLIGQKFIELHHVEIFVLDEADRMLDMGFAPDVRRVIGMLPEVRQNMLFSATMPPEIVKLVDKLLNEPAKVAVTPVSSTVDSIAQSVYFVGKKEKRLLLVHLLQDASLRSVLVFTRTKHGADRVAKDLTRAGIPVAAIHGDKSQNNRVAALTQFKLKKIRVLVATDIAARGIDVDELSHVVNYDLPNVPETYVHRIGRTGRAGLEGVAISFCDGEEKAYLKDIQKLIGKPVPFVADQPYPLENYVEPEPADPSAGREQQRRGNDRRAQQQKDAAVRGGRSERKDTQAHAGRQENSRRQSRSGRQAGEPKQDGTRKEPENRRPTREEAAEFERMASRLAGRPGHAAGRSGKRDVVRAQEGSPSRHGTAGTPARRATADNASRHKSGRPIPSGKPADSRRPADDDEVRVYSGIAAEKPGPFESASFLSQPTRLPRELAETDTVNPRPRRR